MRCIKITIIATYSDSRLELSVGAGKVLTSFNGLAHATVDALPVGATEHGARAEKGQGIVLGACIVDGNIPEHVFADLLSEIDVDTQEVS